MDFLRVGKFRRVKKPDPEKETAEKTAINLEKHKSENNEGNGVADLSYKPTDSVENDEIEDDDDDFITNEVKRRLKELRNNSFMGSIPEEEEEEESYVEEEEEEKEKCQSEWRDVVAEGRQWWGGFDALYEKYCERMLFFDRLSSQQLKETGVGVAPSPSTPSPRSASKKLASPFRCLSLKKLEAPEEETEHLQQQPETDPCNDLETAYVAQLCLTWEALHCQYTQLGHLISCQPETRTSYNHSAQQFQQFLVLLQRFIENEPFEHGSRAELYARTRNAMPKLLQSPKIQGSDEKEMDKETDFMVLADDLMGILESSILTFYVFLKTDKRKPNGNHNNMTTTLLQVKSSLEKVHFSLVILQFCLFVQSTLHDKRPRFCCGLDHGSTVFLCFSCLHSSELTIAEKGESEGTLQENKRVEEEILASNMGRSGTLVCSDRRQNRDEGSEDGEGRERSVSMVRRKDEKTRLS